MFRKVLLISFFLLAVSCPLWANDEAAEIANKQGVFSGTYADAAWTVFTFGLLVVLLGKFAWKPMLNGLNARQEHIAQQIANAEAARKAAEKTLGDYNRRVDQLEAKGLELLKKAEADAQAHGMELAEKARQEALAIKQKNHEDIQAARAVASEEIWQQVGDIVLAIGSEVLSRKLTKEDNQKLIGEAIANLKQQRQTVRG